MKIVREPCEATAIACDWRCNRLEVGFVPTMGALHAGHGALLQQARRENDRLIASIFVNPLQFGPHEDLQRYPRPFEQDCAVLEAAGCDVLLAPAVGAMYLSAPGPDEMGVTVDVSPLGEMWEGAVRPGHLRGVATVVAKLFNITLPNRAYFGEKDYQQLVLVQSLVAGLNFHLQIVPVPTVREPDGLALSSRNVYLSPEERAVAPRFYQALLEGQRLVACGETDACKVARQMEQACQHPLIMPEYFAVVDARTLHLLDEMNGRPARALGAIKVGRTRLIDNIAL